MSPRRSTEDLVHDLAADVAPVRSIASLRMAAAGALLLWIAMVVASWALGASVPSLDWNVQLGEPTRGGVLIGLALAGGGALLAALASAVPGRESAARAGTMVACAGLVVGIGAGLTGALSSGTETERASLGFACTARALLFALPPAYAICAYLLRGVVARGGVAPGLAAGAALGLGAFAVHLFCPLLGGGHVFLGHCAGPVIVAGLLSVPLAWWLARGRGAGQPA